MRNVLWRAPRATMRTVAAVAATAVALPLSMATGAAAFAAAPAAALSSVQPAASVAAAPEAAAAPFDALIFSKTAGFRHDAIPAGIAAIEKLGTENGFTVDVTEDAGAFTDENLAQYEVVIWLSTTGDVLNTDQQGAFERYVANGGGYAGVHAASDTEYDWPWYGGLVGAYFSGHPQNQDATIKVEDGVHPSTAHLPSRWDRHDEWYNFRTSPRDTVHVLASLDETSYDAGSAKMGSDHPIAWCQTYEGGRSWYTGGGHTQASYTEPNFVEHLLGGIQTAAGVVDSDCNATQSASFERVALDEDTSNPMMLDVAPDGTVFYAERDGRVRRIDHDANVTTTALTLGVTQANEDGLLGLVLDPDFGENGWLYAYWSPANAGADGPHNRISRFTYDPAAKTFDLASEKKLLTVTTQRDTCCHAGGDMIFDEDGNLILATGDNTNPFESGGFTPTDERAGRKNFDAQGTSANSNDLRGKVLRITPQDDGTYTVPEGNMFAPGTDKTRPEIYAMGFRNPFRIGIDPASGNVLVGDYGPDSGAADPARGPRGAVEWNVVSEPGFYGWPYCTGANTSYVDFNFATGQSGASFDCAAGTTNDSPNNTGIQKLPAATPAEIWYTGAANPQFPEIGGGGAPMGGPVYEFDPELDSDVKWPAYWDGKALFGEWNHGTMFSIQLDGDKRDQIVDINRVLPGVLDPSNGFDRPMDFDFGPDGALYVIDWGSGFGGNNDSSAVYKVNYVQGDPSPIAHAQADVTSGSAPLTVQFSSEGTRHPAGEPISLQWTFGDGSAPSTEANPTHTYTENGSYTAQLTVSDSDGKLAVANVTIVVGNQAPVVKIEFPDNGGFFEWGDQVRYRITVDDPDGEVDCSTVALRTSLGHDSHAHPMEELYGCEGVLQTARDEGHGIESNIFWVIEGSYTDDGGDAGVPLTGNALQVLQPKRVQSEFYTSTGRETSIGTGGTPGVQKETTSDSAGGGQNLGYIEPGDWWAHAPVSLANVEAISLRVASPNANGVVSLRWDAADGPEIGRITVPSTGDWQVYRDVSTQLTNVPEGSGTLYFVLLSGGINVNWMDIEGRGVTDNIRPDVELDVPTLVGPAPLTVTATATGSDPDGEASDLVYAWDDGLGGGFVDGGPEFSHTYTAAGTYRLQVRVTDAGGAYTVKYVNIKVNEAGPVMCFSGRSDDFTGTAVDEDRWSTIIRRDQKLAVADGHLVIPASKADFYGQGEGPVSNIVLQDLPSGPWTATTKVTFPARAQYQQAGLLLWGDGDNYAKMVIQGRGTGADPNSRVFQFIREENGAPNEVAASNVNITTDFPDTFYVRYTSDGSNLRAYYSADGLDFTAMSETKSLHGLVNPKIGLVAFANDGSVPDVVDAKFDWFHITPDDTATAAGPDDEFEGTSLDGCRWNSVVRPDASGLRVAGGKLEIDTTPTDIYGTGNTDVPNIVLQDQPAGDWTVETTVDGSTFDQQYQQGGLILYGDDDNYVKLDFITKNQPGAAVDRGIEMRSEAGATVLNPQPNVNSLTQGVWWLRLAKVGTTYTGSYSADGVTWTEMAEKVTNPRLADAKIGLYALGAGQQASATATFEHFKVVGPAAEPLTVSGSLDPASPSGANGWWTGPVTVTVATTGGAAGQQVYREYQLDGGAWAEYTAPVVVSAPGEHTLKVRASAGTENVTGADVVVRIDTDGPSVAATLREDRTVEVVATDAVSGVASVEYSLDGTTWAAYDAPVAVGDEAVTFGYRASDLAGNVTTQSVDVPAGETVPVTVSAAPKCVANRVTLAVTAVNSGDAPVTIVVRSAYGTKTFTGVAAGKSAHQSFATRAASIGAGQVTVTATDAEGRTTTYTVDHAAASCG
ncbi:ThuA domain-containing protein [Oerskovia jenensis]|uniref:Glucose/arabinose dehydrogenase/regulation of enolase protein 1 (Concanavalin A-like superfamily) n=1 Tax=Oerskovia jenensis TaxID=162169 RepID=A0ABS2LJC1_9CELL|nr:ThuA domain-containing protein [Oerskovia jenensis]MBM7480533.1 glucose/arabinose dehydrogenase/regulation of enolase protein 1 (concanavalin A-like superfamily) [Oerskovia jenensis]